MNLAAVEKRRQEEEKQFFAVDSPSLKAVDPLELLQFLGSL